MHKTTPDTQPIVPHEAIVASYQIYTAAQEAVSRLAACGLPWKISILDCGSEPPKPAEKPEDSLLPAANVEIHDGAFHIVVCGSAKDIERAREILRETTQAPLHAYAMRKEDPRVTSIMTSGTDLLRAHLANIAGPEGRLWKRIRKGEIRL